MLNGKFYTGLPPNMLERGGSNKNRQESHFFWPDDTTVDSAVETRVKRRTSLQLEPIEKPKLQRHISLGENDIDTKQLFQKEFAKSSIQFCDNIQEENEAYQPRRKSQMKQGISPKPNATRMSPAENVVDEKYTNAKKQQAFTSKIQFYDYIDEDLNMRNNVRKPKMDMNDKKEVEKNSKNSPKLQVKRNAKNLSNTDSVNNDYLRDQLTPERSVAQSSQKIIKNAVYRDRADITKEDIQSFSGNNRRRMNYINNEDMPDYSSETVQFHGRAGNTPAKKILKNTARDEQNYDAHNAYELENFNNISYIDNGMRNVRVRTSPKKHVSYRDETYEREAANEKYFYDKDEMTSAIAANCRSEITAHSTRAMYPNTYAGNNQRQQLNSNTPDFEQVNEEQYQYMEIDSNGNNSSSLKKTSKNYNNYNSNNKLNNQATPQKITPKMSTTSIDRDVESPAADAQKHLRSSLCFNNGEIVAVANNGATTKTPTQRRNARSSATQRVSVGLPD